MGRRAAPVGLETDVDCLGAKDRRRPLDRVDLRDQRGNDQTCRLIDPLVAQSRILRAELVAQDVVLACEERVQAAEPEPPALVETGDLLPVEVVRQVSLGSHPQLRALPQLAGLVRVGPVHLGAVPPGRRLVRENGRHRVGAVVGIGDVPGDPHLAFGLTVRRVLPRHAVGQRHDEVVLAERVTRVGDPVVHLELDPGGCKQVQRPCRQELLAVEQLLAHDHRIRLVEQIRPVMRSEVAAERRANRAHRRGGQVVARAVGRSCDAQLLVGGSRGHRPSAGRRLAQLGVEQIFLPQHVPEDLEVEQAQRDGQPVPLDVPVHDLVCPPSRCAGHLVAQRRLRLPAVAEPVRRARRHRRPCALGSGCRADGTRRSCSRG